MSSLSRKRRAAHGLRRAAVLSERLEDRTLFTVIAINGTTGNDTITVSSHTLFFTFVDYTVNGSSNSVIVGPGDSVQVDTGGGQDTVNVLSTVVPTFVTGHSVSGADDTLNVGDASGVRDIGALLHVENPSGYWNINVNNAADTGTRTETLGGRLIGLNLFGQITGMAPATIEYKWADTDNLTTNTGAGSNTVNILATGGIGYTWVLGNADTTVNVGDAGSTQSIQSQLVIENPPRFNTVTIDDSADTTARTISLDTVLFTPGPDADVFERIGGLAPGQILFEMNDLVSPTTIRAGSGGNMVMVSSFEPEGGLRTVDLYTGTGNDTTTVNDVGSAATLNIHGQNGSDVVTVPASAAKFIAGTLSVDNTASTTALTVDDSSDSTARTVTLDTFTNGSDANWEKVTGLTPGTIQYRGIDVTSPTFKAGPAGNTFNVLHTTPFYSLAPDKTLTLDTGTGDDVVNVQSTAATGTLLIDGQNGNDVANLGNAGSMQDINGPVNLQNHPSFTTVTADDSADTTPRTVTLDTFMSGLDTWQSITGLSPGVISYDGNDVSGPTIRGGSGGNMFTVMHTTSFNPGAASDILTLDTGAGSDTVLVSGVGGLLSVMAQAGDDSITLDFSGGGIGANISVDGGAGLDTLTVQGGVPDDAFTVSGTTITHGSITANYAAIESLVLDPGSFTVTADLNGMNLSTLGAGTTAGFMTTQHLGMLDVGAGTQITLENSPAPAGKTIFCAGLSIAATATLDLTNNALQLNYGALPDPIAQVRAWVITGYNGGAWTGHGIDSSAADATHTLGFADAADGAVTGLPAHNLLVRFTRYGDVNLDGAVGFADLLILAQHYGQSGQNWDQGDMTYDTAVGFPDLLKLAQNYGAPAAVSQPLAATAPQIATTAHALRRRHA